MSASWPGATGLAPSAAQLMVTWNEIKHRVRGLHERLFYRPLLSAVAATSSEDARLAGGVGLTSGQAEARLAAIGFRDPRGALAHIAALTSGVSRRATIQRHLLPVMLQWFADGPDPDYGLLTFRRLSEELGGTHWYLRMLRDSSGAAERLTRVLSGSRFAGELLGASPSRPPGWSRRTNCVRGPQPCSGRRPPRFWRAMSRWIPRPRRCGPCGVARSCGSRSPASSASRPSKSWRTA